MKKLLLFIFSFSFLSFAFGQVLPNDWTGDSGIETYQSSDAHGGSYSVKVVVNTGAQQNCDFDNDVAIPVTAGETCTVKLWYKTSAHVTGRVVLLWSDGSTKWGKYTNAGETSWTELITPSYTVPSGVTSVKIRIRFYDQSGFVAGEEQFIDDITFESPTGTPHTVSNGDFEDWPGTPAGPDDPSGFTATAVSSGEIDLSWALNAAGDDVMVAWSSDGNFGAPANGTDYSVGDVITGGGTVLYNGNGTSYNHTGLSEGTTYYYKAWSVDGTTVYSAGVTSNAMTGYSTTPELPDHWQGDTGIKTFKETTTVHGGYYACKVAVNSASQHTCDLLDTMAVPVTPGEDYLFSFWVYPSAHVKARAVVNFYDKNDSLMQQWGGYSSGSGAWEQMSKSGTVPNGAVKAIVRVRFYDQTGFVPGEVQYVDDFTFESPTGTSLTVENGDMEKWPGMTTVPLNNRSILFAFLLILSALGYQYKRKARA